MVLVPDLPTDLDPDRVPELLDRAKRRGRRHRRIRDTVRAAAFVVLLAAVAVPLTLATRDGTGPTTAAHGFPLQRVQWSQVNYPCGRRPGTRPQVIYVRPPGSAHPLAVELAHCTAPDISALVVYDGAIGPRHPLWLQTLIGPSARFAPIQAGIENPSTGSIIVWVNDSVTTSLHPQPVSSIYTFRHGRYRLAATNWTKTYVVPNVVGESQAEAEATLANVGMPASERVAPLAAGHSAGVVLSQSPVAGSTVPAHTTVSLVVNGGPHTSPTRE
jgi:hypothetical protein